MASDSKNLVLEVWRGSQMVTRGEYSEPSITVGSGESAMLRLDGGGLSDLHAVVNVEDDGSILVLDLGGDGGIAVNGQNVPNASLRSGDQFGIGQFTFRVSRGAEGEQPTDAYAAPLAGTDESADDHGYEEHDLEDVVSFALRPTQVEPASGEKRRAPVLEVHHMWGNMLVDTKQFPQGGKDVVVGARTGHRWSFLGIDMGWVPAPLGFVLPMFTPLWSDVNTSFRSDFVVPRNNLPEENDWTMFSVASDGEYTANVAPGWGGFTELSGRRQSFDDLVSAGKAAKTGNGGYTIPVVDGLRVVIEGGGHMFMAQRSIPGLQLRPRGEEVDYAFTGMLGVGAFVFVSVLLCMGLSGPTHSNESNEIPDRFVELLLEKPEPEKKEKKGGNPDAGEGAKAKKEEGKVGKKEAKVEKAKGNKIEVKKLEIDRQIAENAGVLGAMADSDLNQVLGASGLSSAITSGIGGLIGNTGTQIGSGGLGSRGGGLGGGGTAEGLGGLGTKGMGSGASGYGSGGGNFGAKGEGGIGQVGGDPIILGALDRSLIDEVIKRHMNQIRYCYQRELTKAPSLGGKIVIKFTIAKDGTVSAASTKSTTMGNAAVENCIVGRFMRMQFPEPKGGGIVIVSYPFLFSPG
ncbi:MAG: AgmX/PglI C-terminal domain-containing protein [Myxococcota bacterium]